MVSSLAARRKQGEYTMQRELNDRQDQISNRTLLTEGNFESHEHIDVGNCDKEPIHIPGAIQPHGFLLVLTEPALRIVQVSDNIDTFLAVHSQDLLGQTIDVIFATKELEEMKRIVQFEQDSMMRQGIEMTTHINGSTSSSFDVSFHRSQGLLVLEAEPTLEQTMEERDDYKRMVHLINQIKGTNEMVIASQFVAEEIKHITGYDRVMVYEFDEQWNGSVIAEAKEEHLEPYLGLHYPASDIPKQARELYKRNWLRVVVDVDYKPIPISPANNPLTGEPLNLSLSILRSMSPIHLEYLRNMGVKSTMTISLIHDNELWGLIACHHHKSKRILREDRNICHVIGSYFSKELYQKKTLVEYKREIHMKELVNRIMLIITSSKEEVYQHYEQQQSALLDIVRANGVAIFHQQKLLMHGLTPKEDEIMELAQWLQDQAEDNFYATNHLSSVYPPAKSYVAKASGVIFLSLTNDASFFLWFRPEVIQDIKWAGNPQKMLTQDKENKARLSPRQSFEKWKQIVRSTATPWTQGELNAVQELNSVARQHREQFLIDSKEEAEDRYFQLIELSPVAVMVLFEDKFIFCNDKALEIFQARREGDLKEKLFTDMVHPVSKQQVMDDLALVLNNQETTSSTEGTFTRLDGALIIMKTYFTRVTFMHQDCILVIGSDITDRKRTEYELKELNKQLEQYAHTDGLTGISNRRIFNDILEREWEESILQGRSMSLIMLDIDSFKLFNDHYGHLQGDECLKQVATAIQQVANEHGGYASRYGGEEFAVMLTNSTQTHALAVAEKIRGTISSYKIKHEYSQVSDYVTVSLGAATLQPVSDLPSTTLVSRADEAMYQAKKQGKDQVVGY